MAGLVRDLLGDGEQPAQGVAARHRRPRRRLARSRAPSGGGGHRRAAGFSTDLGLPRAGRGPARRARPSSSDAGRRRGHPRRQAGRDHVARRRRAACGGGSAAASRSATRARSTRSRPGLLLVLVGRATRVQRFLMALPKRYETVARLGWTSTTGDPEGEIAPGRMPRGAARAADRRDPPAPAGVLARSRSAASAPTRWRGRGRRSSWPSARSTVTRFEQLWREDDRAGVRDRVLVGHLRALADRRPRRRLLPRAAPHRHRPVRRRRRRRGADRPARRRARASCPRSSLDGDDARTRRPRRGACPATRRGLRCGCATATA